MPVTKDNLALQGRRADVLRLRELAIRYLNPIERSQCDDVLFGNATAEGALRSFVEKAALRPTHLSLNAEEREVLWMMTYDMLSIDGWAYPGKSDPEDERVCRWAQDRLWVEDDGRGRDPS